MKSCQALQNCNSIDDVVKIINDDNHSTYESYELAAQYVNDCVIESEFIPNPCTTIEEDLEAHLSILRHAGAAFDFPKALETAIRYSHEGE